jgi:large-conductance mechanosensitive channel
LASRISPISTFKIGDGVIRYGEFINAVINFVLVGTALFLVVKLFERLQRKRDPEEEPTSLTSSGRSATSWLHIGLRDRSHAPGP